MSSSSDRPVVLLFVGVFPPVFESSGAARSVAAIVEHLGEEFDFRIVTSAHHERSDPIPDVWTSWGASSVMYVSRRRGAILPALSVSEDLRRPDMLYLNSFLSRRFSWLPLLLWSTRWLRPGRVVLAPRGEFSAGALSIRPRRKRVAISLFKAVGLHRRVEWHVSNEHEEADLRRVMGRHVGPVHRAQDLTPLVGLEVDEPMSESEDAEGLNVVFLSRISPKKNLAGALATLALCRESVHLTIAGPISDTGYWDECGRLIRSLPENVRVKYVGEVPANRVLALFSAADVMFLPTHGENFGHVIAESLAAGTPVLISDRTPWNGVEASGAGWVLGPDDHRGYAEVLDDYASAPDAERSRRRAAARSLAERELMTGEPEEAHRRMLTGDDR